MSVHYSRFIVAHALHSYAVVPLKTSVAVVYVLLRIAQDEADHETARRDVLSVSLIETSPAYKISLR